MAYLTGGGRTRSLDAQRQRMRSNIYASSSRIKSLQSVIKGRKAELTNIGSEGKTLASKGEALTKAYAKTKKDFIATDSGTHISNINKAYGYDGINPQNFIDALDDASQKQLGNIGAYRTNVLDPVKKEYAKKMDPNYKSGYYKTWYEDSYKTAGSFLEGFYKVLTGQKEMIAWVDDTAEKKQQVQRKLNERTSELNTMLSGATNIEGKSYLDVESDIDTYKKAFASKDYKTFTDYGKTHSKKVGALDTELENLAKRKTTIETAQGVTLGEIKQQQAVASQLESSMAHITSLWAGAKRQEQMDISKGGKGGGKARARIGQGDA